MSERVSNEMVEHMAFHLTGDMLMWRDVAKDCLDARRERDEAIRLLRRIDREFDGDSGLLEAILAEFRDFDSARAAEGGEHD